MNKLTDIRLKRVKGLYVKCNPDELKQLKATATSKGLSVSQYVRIRILNKRIRVKK